MPQVAPLSWTLPVLFFSLFVVSAYSMIFWKENMTFPMFSKTYTKQSNWPW